MLRQGQSIRKLVGEGPPLMAFEFGIVAAARACGIEFVGEQSFLDTISTQSDGSVKRSHSWCFNGDSLATFNVPQGTETIHFGEFERRFRDLSWCQANPDHPITHMRAMWDYIMAFRDELRGRKPHKMLRKQVVDGEETRTVTALIPDPCDPEEQAEILRKFEEAS